MEKFWWHFVDESISNDLLKMSFMGQMMKSIKIHFENDSIFFGFCYEKCTAMFVSTKYTEKSVFVSSFVHLFVLSFVCWLAAAILAFAFWFGSIFCRRTKNVYNIFVHIILKFFVSTEGTVSQLKLLAFGIVGFSVLISIFFNQITSDDI